MFFLISGFKYGRKIVLASDLINKPFLINKRANLYSTPPRRSFANKPSQSFQLRPTSPLETASSITFTTPDFVATDETSQKSSTILDKIVMEPIDKETIQNQLTNPKSVLKKASNDHSLNLVNRKRHFGLCVYCLKKPNVDKKRLVKVATFCPKCPGGCWMCEECFDDIHEM